MPWFCIYGGGQNLSQSIGAVKNGKLGQATGKVQVGCVVLGDDHKTPS